MSVISKLTLTDSGTNVADVSSLLVSSDNSMACNNIANYLMALASQARQGSISLQVQNGSVATASGTVTCASVSAGDTVTINGVVFTAVSATPGANEFDIRGNDTADATSLKAAINSSVSALVSGYVTANSALGVVTISAVLTGITGNMVTLATSNNTRLAKSGTYLTGGVNDTATTYTYHCGL